MMRAKEDCAVWNQIQAQNIQYITENGHSALPGKNRKMIEEEYGIPTQDLENTSRKSIEEAFNKEYYKGLKMSERCLL